MRLLGVGWLLGALALRLVGCADDAGDRDSDDRDRSTVDRAEADLQVTVDGVLHDVADRAGLVFEAGNRFSVICGETFAPRGIHIRTHLLFDEPAELAGDDAVHRAVEVLDRDGWSVKRAAQREMLTATKGDVVIDLDFRGRVQVDVDTECLRTEADIAREAGRRPAVDVRWK